jgi:hypothetical protein
MRGSRMPTEFALRSYQKGYKLNTDVDRCVVRLMLESTNSSRDALCVHSNCELRCQYLLSIDRSTTKAFVAENTAPPVASYTPRLGSPAYKVASFL